MNKEITTQIEAAEARKAAEAALQQFMAEHGDVFRKMRELEKVVAASPWRFEQCCGEENGCECKELVPVPGKAKDGDYYNLQGGWVQPSYSCGCGASSLIFCPRHAAQAEDSRGRCNICSR